MGAGLGFSSLNAKAEFSKKGSSTMEEEITRTRTRFSIFSAWYEKVVDEKSIGKFDGWGGAALEEVRPGHTVQITGDVSLVPIYGLMRMFLWFADKAGQKGHPMAQSGPELTETKSAARNMKAVLGDEESVIVDVRPVGDPGPAVAMKLEDRWLVDKLGSLGGEYTVVAQVQRVLKPSEWLLTKRLFEDGPPTALERATIQEMFGEFAEPAEAFGLEVDRRSGEIEGPALWVEPIAIFR